MMPVKDHITYMHPILPFNGKALSYIPEERKKSKGCLVRLIIPRSPTADNFRSAFWNYSVITSVYIYHMYELSVVNSSGTPAYIIRNWNGSGWNIDATANGVNLSLIVKHGIPMDEALAKVMESFEHSGWEQAIPQAASNELADQVVASPIAPIIYPGDHRASDRVHLLPDVLVLNEVNDHRTLTYSMFKAFRENYLNQPDVFENYEEVKLSYAYEYNLGNYLDLKKPLFKDITDKLILMIHGVEADANVIAKRFRSYNPEITQIQRTRNFEVQFNGKQYTQPSRFPDYILYKTADVQVFRRAFVQGDESELPSYDDSVKEEKSS